MRSTRCREPSVGGFPAFRIHPQGRPVEKILQIMNDADNSADHAVLEESWKRLEEIREHIQRLYSRWDELETKKSSGS